MTWTILSIAGLILLALAAVVGVAGLVLTEWADWRTERNRRVWIDAQAYVRRWERVAPPRIIGDHGFSRSVTVPRTPRLRPGPRLAPAPREPLRTEGPFR